MNNLEIAYAICVTPFLILYCIVKYKERKENRNDIFDLKDMD